MGFPKGGSQCHGASCVHGGGAVSLEAQEGGGAVGEKDVGGRSDGRELEGCRVGVVGSGVFLWVRWGLGLEKQSHQFISNDG